MPEPRPQLLPTLLQPSQELSRAAADKSLASDLRHHDDLREGDDEWGRVCCE